MDSSILEIMKVKENLEKTVLNSYTSILDRSFQILVLCKVTVNWQSISRISLNSNFVSISGILSEENKGKLRKIGFDAPSVNIIVSIDMLETGTPYQIAEFVKFILSFQTAIGTDVLFSLLENEHGIDKFKDIMYLSDKIPDKKEIQNTKVGVVDNYPHFLSGVNVSHLTEDQKLSLSFHSPIKGTRTWKKVQ